MASFIGLLLICGVLLFRQSVHDQLRNRIADHLNSQLADIGYAATIRSARWIEGKGLQIDELIIQDISSGTGEVVLQVDNAFVASPFKLVDALSTKPVIESVVIDGLSISAREKSPGQWNLDELISSLCPPDKPSMIDCPVKVRNGRIQIDGRPVGLPEAFFLDEINFDLLPGSAQQIGSVRGHFSAPLIRRIEFLVEMDKVQKSWQAQIAVNDVAVSGELNGLVPEPLKDRVRILQAVRGRVDLHCRANGATDFQAVPQFHVEANIRHFEWLDREAPYRVQNGSFHLQANNAGFTIQNAHADVGAGTVHFHYQQHGWSDPSLRRIVGRASNIEMTDRILPWLPPDKRQAWLNYQPNGSVDLPSFELKEVHGQISRNILIKVRDASFSYYRFPYRLQQCNGEITWANDRVDTHLTAIASKQLVTLRNEIHNPGPNWTGWASVDCPGSIPIDEKLLQAVDVRPRIAKTIRRYRPTGYFGITGRTDRVDPSVEATTQYTISLKQAMLRYEGFDYPFYNVSGMIDVNDQNVAFSRIIGFNNNGKVECNGRFNPITGLNLTFVAETILLDEELKYALPSSSQRMWDQLRPNGTIDRIRIKLAYHPDRPDRKVIDIDGAVFNKDYAHSNVSINPVWFPYEIRQLTGEFYWDQDEIRFRNIQGQHGLTMITADGSGTFDQNLWSVQFKNLLARNIEVDEALLNALPDTLATAFRSSNFQGQLNMLGNLRIAGRNQRWINGAGQSYVSLDPANKPGVEMSWDLQFGFGQASFNAGQSFTNASGKVDLVGTSNGEDVTCQGQLDVDSVMCRGIQLSGIRGPVSINNDLISFGAYVHQPDGPRPLVGRAFGGQFQCNCQIRNTASRPFQLQAAIWEASLRSFALQTALEHHELSGTAYANVQLAGELSNSHSITGKGGLKVLNAKIYELPVMVALLKVLTVQIPDRTAFDEGTVDFAIRGENIDMHRIQMDGDAISLIGRGFVNRSGDIDLDFYSVMGRASIKIPLLSEILNAGGQQILWIKVNGSIDNPKATTEVLPEINEALRKLFGDPG